jgi:hypothetical protein
LFLGDLDDILVERKIVAVQEIRRDGIRDAGNGQGLTLGTGWRPVHSQQLEPDCTVVITSVDLKNDSQHPDG